MSQQKPKQTIWPENYDYNDPKRKQARDEAWEDFHKPEDKLRDEKARVPDGERGAIEWNRQEVGDGEKSAARKKARQANERRTQRKAHGGVESVQKQIPTPVQNTFGGAMLRGLASTEEILLETLSVDALEKFDFVQKHLPSSHEKLHKSAWERIKSHLAAIGSLAWYPAQKAWEQAIKEKSVVQGLYALLETLWSFFKGLFSYIQLIPRALASGLSYLYAKADQLTKGDSRAGKAAGWVCKFLLGFGIPESCLNRTANLLGYTTNLLDGAFRATLAIPKFLGKAIEKTVNPWMREAETHIGTDFYNDLFESGLGRVLKNGLRVLPEAAVIGLYVLGPQFWPAAYVVDQAATVGIALSTKLVSGLVMTGGVVAGQTWSDGVNKVLSGPWWEEQSKEWRSEGESESEYEYVEVVKGQLDPKKHNDERAIYLVEGEWVPRRFKSGVFQANPISEDNKEELRRIMERYSWVPKSEKVYYQIHKSEQIFQEIMILCGYAQAQAAAEAEKAVFDVSVYGNDAKGVFRKQEFLGVPVPRNYRAVASTGYYPKLPEGKRYHIVPEHGNIPPQPRNMQFFNREATPIHVKVHGQLKQVAVQLPNDDKYKVERRGNQKNGYRNYVVPREDGEKIHYLAQNAEGEQLWKERVFVRNPIVIDEEPTHLIRKADDKESKLERQPDVDGSFDADDEINPNHEAAQLRAEAARLEIQAAGLEAQARTAMFEEIQKRHEKGAQDLRQEAEFYKAQAEKLEKGQPYLAQAQGNSHDASRDNSGKPTVVVDPPSKRESESGPGERKGDEDSDNSDNSDAVRFHVNSNR